MEDVTVASCTPLAVAADHSVALSRPAAAGPRPADNGLFRSVLTVIRWPLGGIRTAILYQYPALVEAGYRFTFVGPNDESFVAFREEVSSLPGTEFVPLPLQGPRRGWLPALRRLLHSGGFGLIHSNGLGVAADVVLANLGVGVPHVVTSHDVFREDQFPGVLGRVKLWLLERLLNRADVLISVSQDAKENLLLHLPALKRGKCRQVYIPNGIPSGHFREGALEGASLRERLGLEPGVRLLGFLGRLMPQKGFLPLLDAFHQLLARGTGVPFHLVVFASGDYEREYRAETARRRLDRLITFLPFVADVAPVLRQLDVLVMPSLWEACPLLPMEALASGVPVLGSDCLGLREVLRDTPSVMARMGDAAAWAEALRAAVERPWTEEASRYAPEARRRFDAAPSSRLLQNEFDALCRWTGPRGFAASSR
jgi:glycosyltransferase involved in cell wall biosynthesis